MSTLFDLIDFAPPTPAWAEACFYCTPDETGYYDEQRHLDMHLQLTCAVCGEKSPNTLLFTQSHGITLGGSWERDALICSSLDLHLNHLRYDALHGERSSTLELQRMTASGWRITSAGYAIRPEGWPPGIFAYSSGVAMSLERGAVSLW